MTDEKKVQKKMVNKVVKHPLTYKGVSYAAGKPIKIDEDNAKLVKTRLQDASEVEVSGGEAEKLKAELAESIEKGKALDTENKKLKAALAKAEKAGTS